MCDYCDKTNEIDHGGDCIIYNKKENKYYLVAEYFRDEVVRIEVKYCSQCGAKLS